MCICRSETLGKNIANNVHFQRVEGYHIAKTLKCRDQAEANLNEINRIYENVSGKTEIKRIKSTRDSNATISKSINK